MIDRERAMAKTLDTATGVTRADVCALHAEPPPARPRGLDRRERQRPGSRRRSVRDQTVVGRARGICAGLDGPVRPRWRAGRRGGREQAFSIIGELGTPVPIAPSDVDALFDRYQNVYGQAPDGAPIKGAT